MATNKKELQIPPNGGNPAFAMALKRQAQRNTRGTAATPALCGRVLVKFDPAALQPSAAPVRSTRGGTRGAAAVRSVSAAVAAPLQWLQDQAGLRSVEPLFAGAAARSAATSTRGASRSARSAAVMTAAAASAQTPSEDLAGFTALELDPARMNSAMLKKLREAPGVEAADLPPVRWLCVTRRPRPGQQPKADPRQNSQWALRAIGWYDQALPDASALTVGVLDSGIDTTHPDLAGHIASYDQGGFSRTDHIGHGTHVAGIVAAIANNAVGIAGVANCRLRNWKVFDDEPDENGDLFVDDTAYLRALGNAATSDVRVVNLSLAGPEPNQIEARLLKLLQRRGKLVVASMGNEFEDGNPIEWPAAYPGVIAVGAVTINLRRAAFSNTGTHITIAAPGKQILSTLPMRGSPFRAEDEVEYAFWDGTSMAAPCVAACLALALARRPSLTADDLMAALPKAVRKPASMKSKFSHSFGFGVIHLPALFAAT